MNVWSAGFAKEFVFHERARLRWEMTADELLQSPELGQSQHGHYRYDGAGGDHQRWRDDQRVRRRPRWFSQLPHGAPAAVLKVFPRDRWCSGTSGGSTRRARCSGAPSGVWQNVHVSARPTVHRQRAFPPLVPLHQRGRCRPTVALRLPVDSKDWMTGRVRCHRMGYPHTSCWSRTNEATIPF